MLFNSIEFVIFFPIVTLLFYALPHSYRWIILLAASCTFYMFFIPQYILVLFATILIDYIAAIWIESGNLKRKKLYLVVSIVSTCAVLFVFKYSNFFLENAIFLCQKLGVNTPHPRALLLI
jgi:alginate O-acetyltransferase complex protein AlgI